MSNLKFVREIDTAQFWRKHLGDFEYVKFNPDDMFRWYEALELRGADEIRALISERKCRVTITDLHGIVEAAPHPPMRIVEAWLDTKNHMNLAPVGWGAAALLLFSISVGPNLSGCSRLKDVNPLAMNPGQPNVMMTRGETAGVPIPATQATLPSQLPAPASVASPPTGSTAAAK